MWASTVGLFSSGVSRGVQAVRGIDLKVDEGEFVASLGPNGGRQDDDAQLLSGVIQPSGGDCRVMGFVPWKRENAYRRRFALVMGQKNQLWWDLPAQESFRLHQHIYRIPLHDYEATLKEITELLDIGRLMGRPVRELSLGERMKMELTAALLHSPDVLFLDEPTIGLDVVAQHAIQQFLKRYQQRRGITVLLTSHYMKDVAALCRRAVIITEGQIKYDGSLAGIVDRFSGYKVVTFQFGDGRMPGRPESLGEVLEIQPPRLRLKVPRVDVAVLAQVLASHPIEDVAVEDPPLEEVIASVFAESARSARVARDGSSDSADEPQVDDSVQGRVCSHRTRERPIRAWMAAMRLAVPIPRRAGASRCQL
ncbi:MAG: ATP-binding cassette domain-containing protein [Pirellulaceae bacterium]